MRFSFLKQILSPCEPWMLDPIWVLQGKQLLQGVLMGAEFEPEQPQMDYFVGNRENHSIPQGKNVHVVNLTGFMFRDDGDCGQLGTRSLAAQLMKADAEKRLSAISFMSIPAADSPIRFLIWLKQLGSAKSLSWHSVTAACAAPPYMPLHIAKASLHIVKMTVWAASAPWLSLRTIRNSRNCKTDRSMSACMPTALRRKTMKWKKPSKAISSC